MCQLPIQEIIASGFVVAFSNFITFTFGFRLLFSTKLNTIQPHINLLLKPQINFHIYNKLPWFQLYKKGISSENKSHHRYLKKEPTELLIMLITSRMRNSVVHQEELAPISRQLLYLNLGCCYLTPSSPRSLYSRNIFSFTGGCG